MQGLELSRRYYEAFGRPMLESQFAAVLPQLAVGVVGSGSDCFGFDDEVSRDHDFEPGFCIFYKESALSRRTVFELERAYAKLPGEYEGVRRQRILPVGGNRRGVIEIGEFYRDRIGSPDGFHRDTDWFAVPDFYLAEATNGAVFFDGPGYFSAIREQLLRMPESVRLKKLAGHLLLMGQAGEYNVARCLSHGEPAAAKLAVVAFVENALSAFFLLNRTHQPYYKWCFRAARRLPEAELFVPLLEQLLIGDTDTALIEVLSARIRRSAESQLSLKPTACLEKLAYAVNDTITDADIRTLHILCAVQ